MPRTQDTPEVCRQCFCYLEPQRYRRLFNDIYDDIAVHVKAPKAVAREAFDKVVNDVSYYKKKSAALKDTLESTIQEYEATIAGLKQEIQTLKSQTGVFNVPANRKRRPPTVFDVPQYLRPVKTKVEHPVKS